MPGLDYAREVLPSTGASGIARSFGRIGIAYYGFGPHNKVEPVTCPDCGGWADPLWGDHEGTCIEVAHVAVPTNALGLVRRYALTHSRFTANDLSPVFDDADIAPHSRGPALARAQREGWLERDGYVPSTRRGTNGHVVGVYRSLIFKEKSA